LYQGECLLSLVNLVFGVELGCVRFLEQVGPTRRAML
jgi:hypothetical protein